MAANSENHPAPPTDFAALRSLKKAELIALGLQNWDGRLMLFPASWYDSIPDGFAVETITERSMQFRRGVTDEDRRCGFLAYGVVPVDGTYTSSDHHHAYQRLVIPNGDEKGTTVVWSNVPTPRPVPTERVGYIDLYEGDETWHSGAGWYYVEWEYPEGSAGPYPSRDAAVAEARRNGCEVDEIKAAPSPPGGEWTCACDENFVHPLIAPGARSRCLKCGQEGELFTFGIVIHAKDALRVLSTEQLHEMFEITEEGAEFDIDDLLRILPYVRVLALANLRLGEAIDRGNKRSEARAAGARVAESLSMHARPEIKEGFAAIPPSGEAQGFLDATDYAEAVAESNKEEV